MSVVKFATICDECGKRGPADIERIKTACERHTPCPEDYISWHAWAAKMSKTHRQIKCERCGLYAVWIPKKHRSEAPPQARNGAG